MSGARFDFLRYASVWEDADILVEALAPSARQGRVLSIASAGDNALALLTLDPAEVVAVDLSIPQLAACELRVAAWRLLEREELLTFLGVGHHPDRARVYGSIRSGLTSEARAYWDANPAAIAGGVMHGGKFERYLRSFRRFVLPLVHSRRTLHRLLEQRTREERIAFYEREWDTPRWRMLFRLFFSRALMGRLGRDPAFFAHVEGSVGDRILARTRHALTELPVHTNPYATYIMTGSYSTDALPLYLRPESWQTIRDRLDRLTLVRGAIDAAKGPFHAYNLSDVFEYMSPTAHESAYEAMIAGAVPGARLAYWNLLAPRGIPDSLRHRVTPHAEHAAELHLRDQAWFYGRFHVDEVFA